MKLNQVIALVSGRKTRLQKIMTGVHRGWKMERLSGILRTYAPMEEEGEQLPKEDRHVQLNVNEALKPVMKEVSDFIDLVATQETGNTEAIGDIKIDEEILVQGIPVVILLFLEKRLVDIHTVVDSLPVLPSDKLWNWDEAKSCYVSVPEQSIRTKKTVEVITKAEATKEHPAQTELVSIDKPAGTWTTIHLSGAIPSDQKKEMLKRVRTLQEAVKIAREAANGIEVTQRKVGEALLSYIFEK